jgi:pilus assembly protein FimV
MAVSREQVVQTAEKYVSRGKIEPAIREYRKLLAENPNDINTLNRVGDLYARIQRIDEAVDFFTQIAEQYSTEGFFVKAIAIYKKIIKLDPTRLEVYEKLAELYHRQGLVTEARTQYQVLADYYTKHENAASAIAIYQKMVDLEPENPSYHVKLAEIYQQQQLLEKAIGEYKIIAEMMISHGRPQEAAQVYERALLIDSSNVAFITDAILKLRSSGNTVAAGRLLALATERNPQLSRVARLTGVEEERPKAAPTPEPVRRAPEPAPAPRPPAAAPPPVAFTAPPPAPEPPPEPEPMEVELDLDFPITQDWRSTPGLFDSVAFPEPEVEATPEAESFGGLLEEAPAFAVDWQNEPAASAAPAAPTPPVVEPEPDEIELDLEDVEVFVLDMEEDDDASPSLVKPPPDMAAGGVRGQAWTQMEEAAPPPMVEAEPEEELSVPFETDSALPPLAGMEALPALELPDESDSFDLGGFVELEIEEPELPRSEPEPAPEEIEAAPLPSASGTDPSWVELDELPAFPMPEPLPAPEEEEVPVDADFLERTAAELHPQTLERDEDLVSEAEVLAKYGLEEKALERLREALRIRPENLDAHAQMIYIHQGKGRQDRVIELANQMAGIVARTGDRADVWAKVRRHLVNAGYRIDGNRVLGGQQEPPPLVPELPPPAPASAAPAASSAPAAPRKRPTVGEGIDQMLRGLLDTKPTRPRTPAPQPPAPAAPPPPAPPAPRAPVAEAPSAPPPPAPAPAPPPAPARPGMFNPLEIGEMIENEDLDWTPPAPLGAPLPPFGAAPAASVFSAPGLDDSGSLSWLDEAESVRDFSGDGDKKSSGLFDEEDDFFDLAAEIEQELTQEGVFQGADLLVPPSEQSLEEIVEGFKKGVAEHLSPTDYDTHFNLGIAYREMGLLDEAIGEFQLASKDPRHLVLCCSMLGLCFLDKGLPELAVKWYRRGLEAPGLGEEDMLGLLYDLGVAYLATEDTATAYKTFVEIYGVNTNYRDVVARLEELGHR